MTPPQQKTFFQEQGYLVVEDLLSEQQLVECRKEIDRLHELAAELEAKNDPAIEHFQREPFAPNTTRQRLPVLRKIEQTRQFSEVFKRLAQHAKLIAAVQNLLESDLLLFRSTLMLKPAFHGSVHALHQDSAYWPMRPPRLVTVSIALTDATTGNGCFQVIPKSHEWGLQQWGQIQQEQNAALTRREDVDTSGKIEVPLKAGSTLFFHSLLVHGSGPNRSPNPRNTALYAYFSPHVKYVPEKLDASWPREKSFPVVAGLDGKEEVTFVAQTVSA